MQPLPAPYLNAQPAPVAAPLPPPSTSSASPAGEGPGGDLYPDLSSYSFSKETTNRLRKAGHNPTLLQRQFEKAHQSGDFTKKAALAHQYAFIEDQVSGGNAAQNFLESQRVASTPQETAPVQYGKTGLAQSVFGSIANGLWEIPEAVGKLGVAGAGLTGLIDKSEWERANQGIDSVFSGLKTYVSDEWQRSPVSYDDKNGLQFDLNFENVVGTLSNLTSYVLPGFLTAGGASLATIGARGALKGAATATAEKAALGTLANAGSIASKVTGVTSFLQMFPAYQKEALNNGLNVRDATLWAIPVAAINGAIETANMGALTKAFGISEKAAKGAIRQVGLREATEALAELSGKELTPDLLTEAGKRAAKNTLGLITEPEKLGAFSRYLSAAGKRAGRGFIEQGIPEAGEEFFQSLVENSSKQLYNNIADSDSTGRFADPSFGKYAFDALYGATLGAIVGAGMGTMVQGKQLDPTVYGYVGANVRDGLRKGYSLEDMLSSDPQNPARLRMLGMLDYKLQQPADEGITPEQHADLTDKVGRMAQVAQTFAGVNTFTDADQHTMFAISEARHQLDEAGLGVTALRKQYEQANQLATDPNLGEADRLRAQYERGKAEQALGGVVPTETGPVYRAELSQQQRKAAVESVVNQAMSLYANDMARPAINRFVNDNLAQAQRQDNTVPYEDDFKPTRIVANPASGTTLVADKGQMRLRRLSRTGGQITRPAMLDENGVYVPSERSKIEDSYGQPVDNLDEYVAVSQALADHSNPLQAAEYRKPDNSPESSWLQDGRALTEQIGQLAQTRKKKVLSDTQAMATAWLNSSGFLRNNPKYTDEYAQVASGLQAVVAPVVNEETAAPIGEDVDLLSLEPEVTATTETAPTPAGEPIDSELSDSTLNTTANEPATPQSRPVPLAPNLLGTPVQSTETLLEFTDGLQLAAEQEQRAAAGENLSNLAEELARLSAATNPTNATGVESLLGALERTNQALSSEFGEDVPQPESGPADPGAAGAGRSGPARSKVAGSDPVLTGKIQTNIDEFKESVDARSNAKYIPAIDTGGAEISMDLSDNQYWGKNAEGNLVRGSRTLEDKHVEQRKKEIATRDKQKQKIAILNQFPDLAQQLAVPGFSEWADSRKEASQDIDVAQKWIGLRDLSEGRYVGESSFIDADFINKALTDFERSIRQPTQQESNVVQVSIDEGTAGAGRSESARPPVAKAATPTAETNEQFRPETGTVQSETAGAVTVPITSNTQSNGQMLQNADVVKLNSRIPKKEYIRRLRDERVGNGIHITLYNYNGYVVDVADKTGKLEHKTFSSPEQAVAFAQDYYRSKIPTGSYAYSTLINAISIPAQEEIYGNIPVLEDVVERPKKRVGKPNEPAVIDRQPPDLREAILGYFAAGGRMRRSDLAHYGDPNLLKGAKGGNPYLSYVAGDEKALSLDTLARQLVEEGLGRAVADFDEQAVMQEIIDTVQSFAGYGSPKTQLLAHQQGQNEQTDETWETDKANDESDLTSVDELVTEADLSLAERIIENLSPGETAYLNELVVSYQHQYGEDWIMQLHQDDRLSKLLVPLPESLSELLTNAAADAIFDNNQQHLSDVRQYLESRFNRPRSEIQSGDSSRLSDSVSESPESPGETQVWRPAAIALAGAADAVEAEADSATDRGAVIEPLLAEVEQQIAELAPVDARTADITAPFDIQIASEQKNTLGLQKRIARLSDGIYEIPNSNMALRLVNGEAVEAGTYDKSRNAFTPTGASLTQKGTATYEDVQTLKKEQKSLPALRQTLSDSEKKIDQLQQEKLSAIEGRLTPSASALQADSPGYSVGDELTLSEKDAKGRVTRRPATVVRVNGNLVTVEYPTLAGQQKTFSRSQLEGIASKAETEIPRFQLAEAGKAADSLEQTNPALASELRERLTKAQQMQREGADREAIWQATGLFHSPASGQWSIELDSSQLTIKLSSAELFSLMNPALARRRKLTLGELIGFDELFRIFPELAKMPVRVLNDASRKFPARIADDNSLLQINLAYYGNDTNLQQDVQSVDGRAAGDDVLSLVHELQHAIGVAEGLKRGTSLDAEISRSATESSQYEKDARSLLERARNTKRIEEQQALEQQARDLLTKAADLESNAPEIASQRYLDNIGEREARFVESRLSIPLSLTESGLSLRLPAPAFQLKADTAPVTPVQPFIDALNQKLQVPVVTDPTEIQRVLSASTIAESIRGRVANGFYYNGKLYFDPTRANPQTAVHEFGHLWNAAIRQQNPDLWRVGVNLAKGSRYWNEVMDDRYYRSRPLAEREDEAVAKMVADNGRKFVLPVKQNAVKTWLQDFWDFIKGKLGISPATDINSLTIEQFSKLTVEQIKSGEFANRSPERSDVRFQLDPENIKSDTLHPIGQVVTADTLRQQAMDALTRSPVGNLLKKKSLTKADKLHIEQVAHDTGFNMMLNGKLEWTRPAGVFHGTGGALIQTNLAHVADTMGDNFGRGYNAEGNKGWVFRQMFDKLKANINLESFIRLLDNAKGTLHSLILEPQREDGLQADYIRNTLKGYGERAEQLLAPFSTMLGNSTQTAKSLTIRSYDFDSSGNVVLVERQLPVAVGMGLALSTMTQFTSHGKASGVSDNPPRPDLLYTREANGRLTRNVYGEIYENPDTKEVYHLLLPRQEANELIKRFRDGMGAYSGEVEAFAALHDYFNEGSVADVLEEKANQLNPATPFKRVQTQAGNDSYYPISTAKSESDARTESREKRRTLDENTRLLARTGAPTATVLQDPVSAMRSFASSASDVVAYGRTIDNLVQLVNSLDKYEGPQKDAIRDYLTQRIEQVQNFRSDVAKQRQVGGGAVAVLDTLMRKYGRSVLNSLVSPLKQTITLGSAMASKVINPRYIKHAEVLSVLGKLTVGGYRDLTARGDIDITGQTDRGLSGISDMDTLERPYIERLLGNDITDPDEKKAHLKRWATVINRTVGSVGQFVDGAQFEDFGLNEQTLTNVQKRIRQLDNLADRYFTTGNQRTDRAVVFAWQKAAELSGKDKGLSGEALDEYMARTVTDLLHENYSLSNLFSRTPLSLSNNFLYKMLGLYAAQAQTQGNLLMRAVSDWSKAEPGSSEADAALKHLYTTAGWAILFNAISVSVIGALGRALMAVLSGDPVDEPEKIGEQIVWDSLKNTIGVYPGLAQAATEYLIATNDTINSGGHDALVDFPAAELIQQGLDSVTNMGTALLSDDEKKADKALDALIRDLPDMTAKGLGVPGNIRKVVMERLTVDKDD